VEQGFSPVLLAIKEMRALAPEAGATN